MSTADTARGASGEPSAPGSGGPTADTPAAIGADGIRADHAHASGTGTHPDDVHAGDAYPDGDNATAYAPTADDPTGDHPAADHQAGDDQAGNAGQPEEPWSLTQLAQVRRSSAWVLLVTAILGFVASADLTIERIQLLIDPSYRPSCSINPVLSCGSVMITEQARFFGFPNPLIGIAAFAVVLTTAVLVVGRVRLPRWYWIGLSLGSLLGWIFVHYLIFQSMYRIGALCPYCMVVWTVMPIITVLSISQSLGSGRVSKSIREWLWTLLPVWYAIVIVAGLVEFWYYWRTLF